MKRNERGFTLMELMVVIVIVAILAAVAVPLYLNYVSDAQRTEAKGAIGAVITAEQVYYQKLASDPAGPKYTTDPTLLSVDLTDINKKWTITIPSADQTKFQVKAVQVVTGQNQVPLQVVFDYDRGTQTGTWTP
jgi:type IV pilus assembly protein PilE